MFQSKIREKNLHVEICFLDPPTSSPVITGSENLTDDQPVYEGDNVTLSCTVSGGKPVNATVITFTCPNKNDMADSSFDSFNITSSLVFLPVSSDNHGICQCYARWKNTDWYNKTALWNLRVYSELHCDYVSFIFSYFFLYFLTFYT